MYKYKGESIYIAGPECFYTDGFTLLGSMRKKAEYYGFNVSLPNDTLLMLQNEDLQKNADTIFNNCAESMKISTAIIADLEQFRGSEPDGGTVYEIGMAYALGLRCYAYTRDKRDVLFKHQNIIQKDGCVYDLEGRMLAYRDLPFSPCIIGSCKVLQGDFDDSLNLMMIDLEQERKEKAMRRVPAVDHSCNVTAAESGKPTAYLAGPGRFDQDASVSYEKMKTICAQYGIQAFSPLDEAPGVQTICSDDPYVTAYNLFDRYQQHVRNCDIIIADLGDFHGFEPNSDTAFECGMAWQLGKKCYGYMPDTSIMINRLPHLGKEKKYKDIYEYDVENFNYPINLMFASSMLIYEGNFEQVMKRVAEDLKVFAQ